MRPRPGALLARLVNPRGFTPGARLRKRTLIAGLVAVAASAALLTTVFASASSAGEGGNNAQNDGLGIQPGKIKHVWLIILENKSYDASFTGLNNNTYLWQTLPSQGVLLKNYYEI